MSITIQELTRASDYLKTAQGLLQKSILQDPANLELHKALRDSCIQRFEFCIELSWKVSIKVLGLTTKAPNTAVRDMAQNGLIDDTQVWFEFLLARNKTSHTYDENYRENVEREKLEV